jgi:uncharacterized protein
VSRNGEFMKAMLVFVAVFLIVYGGMHLYFLLRLRTAFEIGPAATVAMTLILAFFVVSPVLVTVLERRGHETAALVIAYTGYTWMGFMFITVSLFLFVDLLRAVLSPMGVHARFFAGYGATVLCLVLASGLSAWGCYEARNPQTTHITIETAKLPETYGGIRIVQLSDVHLGLVLREKRLARILGLVEEAHPDILVSTGDLVDGQMDAIAGSARLLGEFAPPLGKFAVMGNHEFYAGVSNAAEFHRLSGFRLLRGEVVVVADGVLAVAGVDDPAGRKLSPLNAPHSFRDTGEEEKLLEPVDDQVFRLLLKHQPTVSSAVPSPFDLQLSGHTHRGQIFPFTLVTKLFYRYSSGYHLLPGGGRLYVSRGAGTWGPAIRLLAPPEVVIIDLVGTGAS